jgi:integrase
MATKRNNKEGSIIQLPSGAWRAQIYQKGQRISHTEKTKAEALGWIRKTYQEADAGKSIQVSRITLGEFLDSWLASIKPSIRTRTWDQYNTTAKKHILPLLPNLKLVDLRPDMIQKIYNDKLAQGVHPRTIKYMHTVFHSSLEQAEKLGLILRNPANAVKRPRYEIPEMKFMDEVQVNQFLSATQGQRYEALYHLEIATGMRQSELLGLRWKDLDWERCSLIVQHQLKRGFKEGDYFSQPKTRSGRRIIILGKKTVIKLREHWIRQLQEKQLAGNRWKENDLIFPSTIGTPINQNNLYRSFKELLKTIGLPEIRFHDLRHTAATLMLNHGVAPIIVSKRLGHSRVSITLDVYGHLIPEMQNEAAEMIDDLITPIEVNIAHDCTRSEIPGGS